MYRAASAKTPKRPRARGKTSGLKKPPLQLLQLKNILKTKIGGRLEKTEARKRGEEELSSQKLKKPSIFDDNEENDELEDESLDFPSIEANIGSQSMFAEDNKSKSRRKSTSKSTKIQEIGKKRGKKRSTKASDSNFSNVENIYEDNLNEAQSHNFTPMEKTYTHSVSKSAMKRSWTGLNPSIVSMVASILSVYTDQSILSIPGLNKKDKDITRLMLIELIEDLDNRLRYVKLPPGIKLNHLDQEFLTREQRKLSYNLSATIRQLRDLNEEEKREANQRHQLEKYYLNLKKNSEGHISEMSESLKSMEEVLRSYNLSADFDVSTFLNSYVDNYEIVLHENEKSTKRLDGNSKKYNPDEDEELNSMLETLEGSLKSLRGRITKTNRLAVAADELGTLIQLMQD